MDNEQLVSEVERSEHDVSHLDSAVLGVEDLSVLTFGSLDEVNDIIAKYVSMRIPKENRTLFFTHLTQRRDAFFWKAGDRGLIYFTGIKPQVDCAFNAIFWDGRLTKDRLKLCGHALHLAFQDFEVPRVSAYVAGTNQPMKRFLKDLGFVIEGTTRKGWCVVPGERYFDLIQFGLLPEEVK